MDARSIALNPGESTTITFSRNTSEVDARKYDVIVEADPNGNLWEVDRSNNTTTGTVEVVAPLGNAVIIVIILILTMTTGVAGVAYIKFKTSAGAQVCPIDRAPLKYSRQTELWYCRRCGRSYRI